MKIDQIHKIKWTLSDNCTFVPVHNHVQYVRIPYTWIIQLHKLHSFAFSIQIPGCFSLNHHPWWGKVQTNLDFHSKFPPLQHFHLDNQPTQFSCVTAVIISTQRIQFPKNWLYPRLVTHPHTHHIREQQHIQFQKSEWVALEMSTYCPSCVSKNASSQWTLIVLLLELAAPLSSD